MKKENYVRKLRTLLENEVEQAEVLIAAKGFAQELQDMIEKVGRLQNEDLGPVTDQMRDTYGNEMADSFNEEMDGALQEILDNLKVTQSRINSAVNDIADGRVPSKHSDMDSMGDMGGMGDMDGMGDLGADDLEGMPELGDDEFGGDPSMSGPVDEPLGRGMKEAKLRSLQKKLIEARRVMDKLKTKA